MFSFPILEAIGERAVLTMLRRRRVRSPEHVLRMWKQRRRISGHFVLDLMKLAEKHDVRYDSSAFKPVRVRANGAPPRRAGEGAMP